MVRFILLCVFILLALGAVPATAADSPSIAVAVNDSLYPHVRTNERPVAALLRQAAAESPSFGTLVERLNDSNVIVYVRTNRLLRQSLDGQLTFMGTAGGRRYVVVSLAWGRPVQRMMAALGHELQHAVEIAERPDIVDPQSLAKEYAAFGHGTTLGAGMSFETDRALAAGERVFREVFRKSRSVAAADLEPAARP